MLKIKAGVISAALAIGCSAGFAAATAVPAAACTGAELVCVDPPLDLPAVQSSGCLLYLGSTCEAPKLDVCWYKHGGSNPNVVILGIGLNADVLTEGCDNLPV